jgi:hypothetical protein
MFTSGSILRCGKLLHYGIAIGGSPASVERNAMVKFPIALPTSHFIILPLCRVMLEPNIRASAPLPADCSAPMGGISNVIGLTSKGDFGQRAFQRAGLERERRYALHSMMPGEQVFWGQEMRNILAGKRHVAYEGFLKGENR